MKKIILTMWISLLSMNFVLSQIKATTEEGKKVLLSSNGTWEYENEIVKDNSSAENYLCEELISTETDKMTGKTTTASKESLIISDDGGKTGFGVFMMKSSNSIIVSFLVVGAGNCIDDDDKMNILFRDGSRLELVNNGKFNCKGKFTLYFGGAFGKNKELQKLINKEIETIRIWTSNSYVERDFSQSQSQAFSKSLDCLSNN